MSKKDDHLRQVAAALNRIKKLDLSACFDPIDIESRPNAKQMEVINDFGKIPHQYITAGNQSLPYHALIHLADGQRKPIGKIQVGDEVLSLNFKTGVMEKSKVVKLWNHGRKEVFRYYTGDIYCDRTDYHEMVQREGDHFSKRQAKDCKRFTKAVYLTEGKDTVDRNLVGIIGYLLGDGCLTQMQSLGRIQFTNCRSEIVERFRGLLEPGIKLNHYSDNGDYFIVGGGKGKNPYFHYIEEFGLNGRAAGTKFIPDEFFTQSLESRALLLEGLIATDGCIQRNGRRVSYHTTSPQLGQDVLHLLSTMGIEATLHSRKKLRSTNHAVEWTVSVSDIFALQRLRTLVQVPGKPWPELPAIHSKYKEKQWTGIKVSKVESLGFYEEVYDITVSHSDHNYLADGFVTGNSGKCLAHGTLVATPKGPVEIQNIKPGDTVFDENAQPIKVLELSYNGFREVVELTCLGRVWATATENHVFLTEDRRSKKEAELSVANLHTRAKVIRQYPKVEMGIKDVPEAYVLGAMLGDGCCARPSKTRMIIASENPDIPNKVAEILGTTVKQTHRYLYKIGKVDIPFYAEWCEGKKAHEKIADLQELLTWNRESLLKFIAGVYDTDGCLTRNGRRLHIRIGMQAESVIRAIEHLFLALWQTPASIYIDAREKYVNGPLVSVSVTSPSDVKRILEDLAPYIQTERKKFPVDFHTPKYTGHAVALKQGNRYLTDTYDLTVDSPRNLYCLANGLVTHNSQLAARLCSWVFQENHPTWKRPEKWKDEKLLMVVMGRTTTQITNTIWSKIKSYLPDGCYKEQIIGNQLTSVTHENGNKIIFLSHHSTNEAREKVQSFVAHFAWIDELPGNVSLIEEVERRIQARGGMFLCTFTPKSRNEGIKKKIDASRAPYAKKYQFSMFDNPIYDEEKKLQIMQSLEGMTKTYIDCVLHGNWMAEDSAVYSYVSDDMCSVPPNYSPTWRHVEASDPASSSKFGFTLWAEDPKSGIWYCVKAEKIEGLFAPDEFVDEIIKRTQGYNVIRRIADGHETWYIRAASKKGLVYMIPYDKNSRKHELIRNFQGALSQGKIKLTPWCDDLAEELSEAQWSDTAEGKIKNGSKYHLCDASQYFVDCKPKGEVISNPLPWSQELRDSHDKRKKIEASKQKMTTQRMQRRRR